MERESTKQRLQLFLKYALDKLVVFVGLIMVSPVFFLVSISIILDDGWPVIFSQRRLGQHGQVFFMIKFRTMKVNCPVVTNADGSTRVDVQDPRLTRVGGFLRRTSLDELPQVFNVLVGHMSIIGPRPDLPNHVNFYTKLERGKLRVRPGITGLAQVTGRNDLPWKERIALDNYYIENYSLWLDLRILLSTVAVVATGRGITQKGAMGSDQGDVSKNQ